MSKQGHNEHDGSYKNIFSSQEMMEGLLKDFVHEDFIKSLDLSTLEPWQSDFISDDLQERREDMIWRVKLKEQDQYCFLMVMLEFQSSVDPWMAVRMLTYTGLLYQNLIKKELLEKGQLLPAVFPLVLYNGNSKWTAATEINKLIEPLGFRLLGKYLPSQSYFIIDEGSLSSADVEKGASLTALFFQLERSKDLMETKELIRCLLDRTKDDARYAHLLRALGIWFTRVVVKRLKIQQIPDEVHNLQEVHAMLAENVEKWIDGYRAEGIALGEQRGIALGRNEGIALGRNEGITLGKAEMLLILAEKQFPNFAHVLQDRIFSIKDPTVLDELFTILIKCDDPKKFEETLDEKTRRLQ